MTTNKTIFKSKEHYQAFRKAWSNAVNSKDAKSRTEPCDEWSYENGFSKGTGSHRVYGNVTAAHMVLYNILRGRAYDHGFTPITRPSKLRNGFYINHGLYHAVLQLKSRIKDESFLAIFEGTVDVDMVSKLQLPECKPMNSDYGPYKKVAAFIVESHEKNDLLPTTMQHIESIRDVLETEAA